MDDQEALAWYLGLSNASPWRRYCRDLSTGRLVVIGSDACPGPGWRILGQLGRRTTWGREGKPK